MNKKSPLSRSGRFAREVSAEAAQFTESISFDWRLWEHDITGSIAHATMLKKIGVLKQNELSAITKGLNQIGKEIAAGKFSWKPELEDVHMNIEAELTKRVPAGAKLHTARSRNDQVALDVRLWLRDEITLLLGEIANLQRALVSLGEKNADVIIPGYTHLQRAQPVYLAHHLLAYVEMLERDCERLWDCHSRVNICPLGSGAIADAYTTGSSLMPQKKNPDIAELTRGKTGRVFGNLMSLLTLLKGLPMTYNRDLQEDKERLFDTADTVRATTRIFSAMLKNVKINCAACDRAASDPALLATDLADYLVKKGMPFRQAHHVVGAVVALAEITGKPLNRLTLMELQTVDKTFGRDALGVFNLKTAMAKRNLTGAPGTKEVAKQLARWREQLS